MMQVLVFAALAAVACADVKPLSFQYGLPYSSYDVPQSSITASPKFFNFSPTSPSASLRLPIHEHQNFGAQISNLGSFGLSTPGPFVNTGFQFTTAAPNVGINNQVVSSTPAPNVEINGFSTPSPQGVEVSSAASPIAGINSIESSTAAPAIELSTGGFSTPAPIIGGSSFGFSTPIPNLDLSAGLVSSTQAPNFYNSLGLSPGFNFGINSFSTPAPFAQFGSGSLTSIGPSVFSRDAALNGVQVTSSGGLLSDSFGISTLAPTIDVIAGAPQVQKNVYYFAAPEEQEAPRIRIATPEAPRTNVNYIFVKAPAPARVAPIRIVAPPKQQEKTVVYVLVKNAQEEQEIELHSPEPTEAPKPEVFFIKYKNQQEAEEAISKVQSGQAASHEHVAANNVGESNSFISHLDRANYNTQPIVNYVKSAKVFQPTPYSAINSGIFYSTTSAPIPSGLSLSTVAPSLSGFTASTPASILNIASQQSVASSLPYVNAYSNSFPQFSSLNVGSNLPLFSGVVNQINSLPDANQNLLDTQFSSSTIAPESLVSSTVSPVSFESQTAAPFLLSGQQSNFFKTSSPSPFSVYGAPLIKKK